MMDTIAIKMFDATMRLYSMLYIKEYARGGITDEEFLTLRALFMDATFQAKNLMNNSMIHCYGEGTEDIDALIDYAIEKEVIYNPKHWRIMYHGIRKRIEEKRIVQNDKRNILSCYDLLKVLNRNLSAWYIVEKETGNKCERSPELYLKMCNYLSGDAPLINYYPGITIAEQEIISEEVSLHYAGEYVDYICEFTRRMRMLMKERGLKSFLSPLPEMNDRVQGPLWGAKFKNEIERKVLLALQEKREVEFIYYDFKRGVSHTSLVRVTPVKLRYDAGEWILLGKYESNELYEFDVSMILCMDDVEVSEFKDKFLRDLKDDFLSSDY